MPKKVDEIRQAILRDNPGMSEKSSWAMAYATYNKSKEKTSAELQYEKFAGENALALERFARKLDHVIRGLRGETPKKLMDQHRLGQRVRKGSELLEAAMQASESLPQTAFRPGKDWK